MPALLSAAPLVDVPHPAREVVRADDPRERLAQERVTASETDANSGATRVASANTSAGKGVGRSAIGACVNVDGIVAPDSEDSVATRRPCCAAYEMASCRSAVASSSVSAGPPVTASRRVVDILLRRVAVAG
jgi:hypothetical protein